MAPLSAILQEKTAKLATEVGKENYKLEAAVTKHSAQDPVTFLDRLAVIFR